MLSYVGIVILGTLFGAAGGAVAARGSGVAGGLLIGCGALLIAFARK